MPPTVSPAPPAAPATRARRPTQRAMLPPGGLAPYRPPTKPATAVPLARRAPRIGRDGFAEERALWVMVLVTAVVVAFVGGMLARPRPRGAIVQGQCITETRLTSDGTCSATMRCAEP